MPLAPGTKLGNFEILSPLGKGGMGEVFRARDTKLGREVAVKVLPAAFAGNPERLARFEREAKVLASLNHPNIATIYTVEESTEGKALVMELVPGAPIQGPVPLETALKYATQIASALDAAHEKGITHRDLKPGNIMLTPDGVIKVLDFGLAAISRPDSGVDEGVTAATLSMSPTAAGMILGTAPYMSPEQASGQTVDRRTDIWAFGVVLYELLTGRRMFSGDTVAHTLANVLNAEIRLDAVPARVQVLLRACLEREVKDRLGSLSGWQHLIPSTDPVTSPPHPSGLRRPLFAWTIAAASLVAAGIVGVIHFRTPANPPVWVRADLDLGSNVSIRTPGSSTLVVSPDGSKIAYVGVTGEQSKLFLRKLDQMDLIELTGTEGALSPLFSPDSRSLLFYSNNALRKVDLSGSVPVPLIDQSLMTTGATWLPNGDIVFTPLVGPLMRLPRTGGMPQTIAPLGKDYTFVAADTLPGGNAVLIGVYSGADGEPSHMRVEAVTVKDGKRKVLVEQATAPRYLAAGSTGYLLYTNRNRMFAAPFDPSKLELLRPAVPVFEDVAIRAATKEPLFSVSTSGTLVYKRASSTSTEAYSLGWIDATGKRTRLAAVPFSPGNAPALSHEGTRVASDTEASEVQVLDVSRQTWNKVTYGDLFHYHPLWGPGDRSLVLGGLQGLYWVRPDGSTRPKILIPTPDQSYTVSTTADGKLIAFFRILNPSQIWTTTVEERDGELHASEPVVAMKQDRLSSTPTLSPDGKWIAYTSDSNGTSEVYVRALPDHGGLWKITEGGGDWAMFSPKPGELLFSAHGSLMSVTYTEKAGAFVWEKPKTVIEKLTGRVAAFAPDTKRVLLLETDRPQGQDSTSHQIVLFQNFLDYLRQRIPI